MCLKYGIMYYEVIVLKYKKMVVIVVGFTIALYLIYNTFITTPDAQYDKSTRTYYDYFDTIVRVTIYGNEIDEEVFSSIEDRLSDIDRVASKYDYSEDSLNALNKNGTLEYNEDLARLLQYGIDAYNDYSIQMNVALGPVIDIWKNYMEVCNESNGVDCSVPTSEELEAAAININPNNILIDDKVISIDENMQVDLGAITKGYTADEISNLLEEHGVENYLIDVGGNIYGSEKPDGSDFSVGIVNPLINSEAFTTLSVSDKSIVTSGDYERFYTVDDVRYSHLINSETLFPSQFFKSVTIISDKSIDGDIWSTMIFNLPYTIGLELVESRDDIECIWFVDEGEIYKSSGVSKYEKKWSSFNYSNYYI